MDAKTLDIINKIESIPGIKIKYVHSWVYLGGNVDSGLFDSYEDAARCTHDGIRILPVIISEEN
jgi:hypothetical protein